MRFGATPALHVSPVSLWILSLSSSATLKKHNYQALRMELASNKTRERYNGTKIKKNDNARNQMKSGDHSPCFDIHLQQSCSFHCRYLLYLGMLHPNSQLKSWDRISWTLIMKKCIRKFGKSNHICYISRKASKRTLTFPC